MAIMEISLRVRSCWYFTAAEYRHDPQNMHSLFEAGPHVRLYSPLNMPLKGLSRYYHVEKHTSGARKNDCQGEHSTHRTCFHCFDQLF